MIHDLQVFLHKEIPLTKAMALKVSEYSRDKIILNAPLKNNGNDKGSVFGGSSSTLMIISAWSLVRLNCLAAKIICDIVIHKNKTSWKKAQFNDLIAVAEFSKVYDFEQIAIKIAQNRHARISCLIEIQDENGVVYSTMEANYVIIPQTK